MKLKKIGAIILAVMMLAVVVVSLADGEVTLTSGEVGGSSTFATDNPTSQSKAVKIAKELTVYNKDETTINAPTITYSYKITADNSGVSITDATSDHANNTAVTVETKAGELTNLSVNGTAGDTGTISWTPTETVTAADTGAANLKYLTIDFTNVVFGAAGVYRYVITETPHTNASAYADTGVAETVVPAHGDPEVAATAGSHVRYLDVYVRPVTTGFTDGTVAADWDIYGYVCVLENEDITDAGDTATTGAVKTNGFVSGTNDGVPYLADSYYTFNVTVSKTVTNDAYAKATHAFPFTVIFTNAAITENVDINVEAKTTGTVGGFTNPEKAALSAATTKGIVTLKDSSSVKYVGIPAGTTVEVYETNDMAGVTYQVTTTVDGTTDTTDDTVDTSVVSGSTPTVVRAQGSSKNNYESTKATITSTVNSDDDVAHTIAVDNNMQLISPTGYISRFAPYALILIGGIALLVVAKKHKKHPDEE